MTNQSALNVEQRRDLARARRAARWVGLILPLGLLTAALALVLVWLPRLPDPAATHWSGSGGPDGFGSPWTYVWLLLLSGHGIVLMMWGFIALGSRASAPSPKRSIPRWSGYQRLLAAFSAGFAVLMTVTTLASAGVQLDLADAHDAGGIGGAVALGFGAWALVSAVAWFAQPKVEIGRGPGAPSEPLPLAPTERAVWVGEVRPSKVFLWVLGFGILSVLGATVLVFTVSAEPFSRWVTLGALLLMVGLGATSSWFRVRIDARGLEARSLCGWPVFRLPAAEVASVEAARIEPLTEFGGWGMRWAPGRFGLVMRAGDGVIATRTDGRIFALTLDDAETAAAALAAAAAKHTEESS